MICPECDSEIADAVGAFDCPDCRSHLVKSATESAPRVAPTVRHTPPTGILATISGYPIIFINGEPRYRCVVCNEPTHIVVRPSINKNGTVHLNQRTGQRLTGYRPTPPRYYTGSDGLLTVKRVAPTLQTGPVCPLHERRSV